MKVTVEQSLHAGTSSTIDLPVSSWEEIDEWYVKLDVLHYHVKGEEAWRETGLNSTPLDVIDRKRLEVADLYGYSQEPVLSLRDLLEFMRSPLSSLIEIRKTKEENTQ
jgi:hypothetical protein